VDTWTRIANGREAFGDYLAGLSAAEWNTTSWCDGWTVKDVAAHLLVIPTMAKGKVFRSFVGSGFDLDRMNAKFVRSLTAELSPAEIAARTRSSAGSRSMPPGLRIHGVATELAVHSADISEAVGRPFDLPSDYYVECLTYLKDVKPVFKARQRAAGLRLQATDVDWSTGTGPTVSGPAKQLLLALAARPAAGAHLSGDGLATFRSR